MHFQNVTIEALGYLLPARRVSSVELEEQLTPVYQRLGFPLGRLEAMTGIAERRFWEPEVLPSQASAEVAELTLQAAGWDRSTIGAIVHASVCRDRLEPATACRVHHLLGLPSQCLVYDVSNACLGMLNGMLQVASLIEWGHIPAGLVVGTESSRALVEETVAQLLQQPVTRQSLKPSIASLTIGSGACAVLLAGRSRSRTGTALDTVVWRAETTHHHLCQSTKDDGLGHGMRPLMATDAETLLQAGVTVGKAAFAELAAELAQRHRHITHTVCHQVGSAHRKQILEALGLKPQCDFITYPWLGNTGSVALPISLALAARQGFLSDGDCVGLLGIGSGINCLMMTVDWHGVAVSGVDLAEEGTQSAIPQSR